MVPQPPPLPWESFQRVAWTEVLRVLDDDRTREFCLGLYREGFRGCRCRWSPTGVRLWTADDFAHRRAARECLAESLTATDDWLESLPQTDRRVVERRRLREVRRRLERERWP